MAGRGRTRLAAIVVGAAVTSGCGGTPAPPPPDQVVRDSYTKLVQAKTVHLVFTADSAGGTQPMRVSGSGDHDFGQSLSAFTMSVPGAGDIRMVQQGTIAYLGLPAALGSPGGKPWLRIDPAALRDSGPVGQQLAQAAENPFGQLALVQGATPDTRVIGPGTVAGEPTTQYATTIDFARARQNTTDPSVRAALDNYATKVGGPVMSGEAWVDAGGRLRKLLLNIPAAADSPPATATLEFSALGAPIPPIVPPPADQVADAAQVIARPGG